MPKRIKKASMDELYFGVEVTIIDLGLSRMNASESETYWTPFEQEVFEGEGMASSHLSDSLALNYSLQEIISSTCIE